MQFSTLVEMLDWRAHRCADQAAFTFNDRGYTYQEVWDGLKQCSTYLTRLGLERGAPVIILLTNGPEFFWAFYGVLLAGGVAIPLFPDSDVARVIGIARHSRSTVIILPELKKPGFHQAAEKEGLRLVRPDDWAQETVLYRDYPSLKPEDLAFIQYTSGSTGNPKGVMLTHANLLTNMRQMIAGMEITPKDVFVSWLPVYHDMGLILKTIVPFYLGAALHLLAADLRNVRTWLETIHKYQGTFTAAPDFAYRLVLRSLGKPQAYDLSSLRVALNAAEPVRFQTIIDFERSFNLAHVMVAGYGLAEATVGVSMMPPGSAPRVDRHGFVSVGRPFPGIEIKIVQANANLPPGEVGEIAIHSPANSQGYLHQEKETENLFWQPGYLLSGDLGYLDEESYLTIVGRKKAIIKVAGQTIAPQEVEEQVDAIPGVRMSAAVGIDRGEFEGEQVVIFAEARGKPSPAQCEAMVLDIVNAFQSRLGFRPGRVFLLQPHTIPRTHNGKIQYLELKSSYLQGDLAAQGKILFPDF